VSERLALHLDRMLESANLAADYVRALSRNEFLLDRKTQQAVVLNLMVIGETVNRLQVDDPDFLAQHPALPWNAMRGMRNRIAHGYFDIDMAIVWETVQRDLPALIAQLSSLRPAGSDAKAP
jgi:uncharacterized protein with HEPN domain